MLNFFSVEENENIRDKDDTIGVIEDANPDSVPSNKPWSHLTRPKYYSNTGYIAMTSVSYKVGLRPTGVMNKKTKK